MIDNRDIVRRFISPSYVAMTGGDGDKPDTFWYTELIDREGNGSARFKLLRTFEHTSREQFDEQMDTIVQLCERNNVRAMTRLSARSRKQIAVQMMRRVTMEFTDGHYEVFGRIYASVLGTTAIHERKFWLWDIDERSSDADLLATNLAVLGKLVAIIPSRKGCHLITPGFHVTGQVLEQKEALGVTIHKDNPTNLYIPDGAK